MLDTKHVEFTHYTWQGQVLRILPGKIQWGIFRFRQFIAYLESEKKNWSQLAKIIVPPQKRTTLKQKGPDE